MVVLLGNTLGCHFLYKQHLGRKICIYLLQTACRGATPTVHRVPGLQSVFRAPRLPSNGQCRPALRRRIIHMTIPFRQCNCKPGAGRYATSADPRPGMFNCRYYMNWCRPHAVYTAAPITYAARIRHRSRCRTRAGSPAGHVYNLDIRCRAREGRQYIRHQSGTSVCWPAASGFCVEKLQHLRCRMCRPCSMHCRRHLPA
jgi:hypothetical protein